MNTFADIGINNDLLKGLSSLGFQEPTPVQEQVIPLMLERQVDLVGLAQTGTGKTAAFGLPLIQMTNTQSRQTQGLVLCPTRELCVQVAKDLEAYSRHVEGLRILAIYGGASIELQIKVLRKGVQIIVATPGRLCDLINRRKVDISGVRYVVIDEADEMLQMGFQDELNAILAKTPSEKNTLLSSATMSREVAAIAKKYMSDPVEVTIGKPNAGAENVHHEYYMVQAKHRYLALKRIVDNCPNNYSIIFCRTRQETQEVANKLIQDGYNADALHGDLSQPQRDQVMKKFRCKNLQLLVATDVAARGLDVNDLTHVINYNLPDDIVYYTHRSGRTGRAGRTGTSVAIVHMKERFKIGQIEKKIKKKFKQCRIPSGEEICKKQLVSLVDVVTKVEVDHDQIDSLYAEISERLGSLDRQELIKKFLSLEFNRFLEYYKNAPDLNVSDGTKNRPGKRERQHMVPAIPSNRKQKYTRFFLNVGRRDGIMPQGLIGKIKDVPGVGRIKVGKIEIMQKTALLEADSKFTPQVLDAFQHVKINGKTVSIEVARDNHGTSRPRPGGMRHRKGRKFKAA
jgi:ATP-dependent RNA helicase DeaD